MCTCLQPNCILLQVAGYETNSHLNVSNSELQWLSTVCLVICHGSIKIHLVFNVFFFSYSLSSQMALCCSVHPASVAGAGRDLFGSTVTLQRPLMRNSAKLVYRLRLESQMPNGCQRKVLLLHQTQVGSRYMAVMNQAPVLRGKC